MRTTLAINDDILRVVKSIAEMEDKSLGQEVSELLRKSLTDTYLLGLCKKKKGRLATFDKRIVPLGIVRPPANLVFVVSGRK